MKRNVYFLQINVSDDRASSYLPYAIGCICAYLKSKKHITDFYEIKDPIFFRDPPEIVVGRMDNPYLVGLSCALWNTEYNKAVAKEIKRVYPDCIVVLGGHNIRHNNNSLKEYPYSDFLMSGEGEVPFEKLLSALNGEMKIDDVPNLIYKVNGKYHVNEYISDFDITDYPSPYTSGIFEKIIEDNPDTCFDIILETNRGCPYLCSYCDWCFTKKIRQFPIERVRADIEWTAKHNFEYLYCADANFGILDRDVSIAEYVIEMKNKYGFPKIFRPTYAKDSNENVFSASKMLNDNGLEKGVTISYQTMSEAAQKNIGRSNITIEHFHELWEKFNAVGIPTYTELILGLPGETYDSFSKGICKLIDAGQHNSLSVYICQVYKNSPLADKEYMKKYGIKTVRSPIHSPHSDHVQREIEEYFNLIYQTDSMPFDDWKKSYMFSMCVQTFHYFGLLRCFAIYLRNEKNVSYYDFYNSLVDYVLDVKNQELFEVFGKYYKRLNNIENDNLTDRETDKGGFGWYFEEGAFLQLLKMGDKFYSLMIPFLKKYNFDGEVYNELVKYQHDIIRKVNISHSKTKYEYDFYSYFKSIYEDKYKPLEKKKTVLTFNSSRSLSTLPDYTRFVILQGRRRGDVLITNSTNEIEVTYPEK